MQQANLSRLNRVELRQIWGNEATNFTPWLAENISLLGEATGMTLEVQSIEQSVGVFRADIIAKDTMTDGFVLIENQLERTDHGHLGQLLTYASGLKAVTIMWVASDFTEEHRSALDWLNEITSQEINFFGLEIELRQIGESPIAPKFNIVSKPNNWQKVSMTNVHAQRTQHGSNAYVEATMKQYNCSRAAAYRKMHETLLQLSRKGLSVRKMAQHVGVSPSIVQNRLSKQA